MKRFRAIDDPLKSTNIESVWDDSDEELNSDYSDDSDDGCGLLNNSPEQQYRQQQPTKTTDHLLLDYREEFYFPSSSLNGGQLNIQLRTSISSKEKHTGTHLWNCSVLLTHYLIGQLEDVESELLLGRRNNEPITVLELGCGLGLPSLATCKINPKNRCILTDLKTSDFEKRCKTQCEINGLERQQYEIIPIDWGNNFLEIYNQVNNCKKVDLLIATDCLYDKKLYDPFFSTVYFLKKLFNNPELPLLLAQYKRNESDNITYQLKRWKLKSKPVHWKEGIDLEKYLKIMGKRNENLEKQFYELYDSTQIVIIQ